MENTLARIKTRTTPLKIGACITLILLIAADVYAFYDLFINNRASERIAIVYGILFAVILNGVPVIMGSCLATCLDETTYKANAKKSAWVGFAIGSAVIVGALILACVLRYNNIEALGGRSMQTVSEETPSGWTRFEYYRSDDQLVNDFYPGFIVHVFMLFSPILTSLFSFIISWTVFRKDNDEVLDAEVEGLHKNFLKLLTNYRILNNSLIDMKLELWSMLSIDKELPEKMSDFKKSCFQRIRSMLIANNTRLFPHQLERIMAEMEGEIVRCINDIAQKSNIAHKITEIDIKRIITDFDSGKKDSEKWNNEEAFSSLQKEFEQLINNAIIVKINKVDIETRTEDEPY